MQLSGVLRKGELRYTWTSAPATTPAYRLANYTFTGQYSHMDDPTTAAVTEGFGLMFYNARWYDPSLGRFAQADTIVPGGAQGLDRYAYANNSPIIYTDPTGHLSKKEIEKYFGVTTYNELKELLGGNWADLLWETSVTWGDEVIWFNDEGEEQRGVIALFTVEGTSVYTPVIFGIAGEFDGMVLGPHMIDTVFATGKHYDAEDLKTVYAGSQCRGQANGLCSDDPTDLYYVPTDYVEIHQEYYLTHLMGWLIPEGEVPTWIKIVFGGAALEGVEFVGDHIGWTSSYAWEHTVGGPSTTYLTIVLTTNQMRSNIEYHLTIPGNDWLFGGN